VFDSDVQEPLLPLTLLISTKCDLSFSLLVRKFKGLEGRRCDGRLLVALRLATPVGGLGNTEGTEIRVPLLGGSVNNTSADWEDIKGCDKAKLKNFNSRLDSSFGFAKNSEMGLYGQKELF